MYQRKSNAAKQKAGFTDVDDYMEKGAPGPRHMVHLKLPINHFLLKQNKAMRVWKQQIEIKTRNALYLAIGIIFLAGLIEVRHDEWPHTPNVCNYLDYRWHLQFVCDYGAAETGLRHHTITVICPFKRKTLNSVKEKWSEQPITDNDTFRDIFLATAILRLDCQWVFPCTHCPSSPSTYVSARMWDPPNTATAGANLSTAATTDPTTHSSPAALLSKLSITMMARWWKFSPSQVRSKAQMVRPRFSNSGHRVGEPLPIYCTR